MDNYKQWHELIKLASIYDWAVETGAYERDGVDRDTAIATRNRLIKLASQVNF